MRGALHDVTLIIKKEVPNSLRFRLHRGKFGKMSDIALKVGQGS